MKMRESEEVIMVEVFDRRDGWVELKFPRDYTASLGGWWQAVL
jgi:hypothetical protein